MDSYLVEVKEVRVILHKIRVTESETQEEAEKAIVEAADMIGFDGLKTESSTVKEINLSIGGVDFEDL